MNLVVGWQYRLSWPTVVMEGTYQGVTDGAKEVFLFGRFPQRKRLMSFSPESINDAEIVRI